MTGDLGPAHEWVLSYPVSAPLTKREQFAMAIMAGCAVSFDDIEELARRAVKGADALITELEKKP